MAMINGYTGICRESGKHVNADEALNYAMKRCGIQFTTPGDTTEEFKQMLIEWFYSGCWLENTDGT
jgi:hypothetical protein